MYQTILKLSYISILSVFLLMGFVLPVRAEISNFGVHILHPDELPQAKTFLSDDATEEDWHYVTVPLGLNDIKNIKEWRTFFEHAKELKIIPIIRLASRFDTESGTWKIPTRKDIVDLFAFLREFKWPTDERYVIIFNEVNHAPEWGGELDPAGYAALLQFAADWAHSEGKDYQVLPAAMDLAAPNGGTTMEAFTYLQSMYRANPEVFESIDYWNSHSYPNPEFSSAPTRDAQNSLRGFLHELAWLKDRTGRDFEVFITETGWIHTPLTSRWLSSYYLYALQHVWSDPQVKGVTPFLLKGDPGPFAAFGFIDRNNRPTPQYNAVKQALKEFRESLE